MLRITVQENTSEQRWILQGRLTKRSVAELLTSWKASSAEATALCRIVDMNEVTSIDKSGEEALSELFQDGAKFVADGVYTRHLLEQLERSHSQQEALD